MAPAQLEEAMSQSPGSTADAVGKLITDSTWYFACVLTEEQADRLTEGRSIEVRFSRDWSGEVDMTVERIGDTENGRSAVVFSTDKFLSDTTLLRRQTVEQALRAQAAGADYLGVGAVFPTGTKDDADAVSYDTLKAICEAVDIPVVAIGGIGAHNVQALAGSGICGIAVVSAIYGQPDIQQAARTLRAKTEEMISQ